MKRILTIVALMVAASPPAQGKSVSGVVEFRHRTNEIKSITLNRAAPLALLFIKAWRTYLCQSTSFLFWAKFST